jgi:hypothetical protein
MKGFGKYMLSSPKDSQFNKLNRQLYSRAIPRQGDFPLFRPAEAVELLF